MNAKHVRFYIKSHEKYRRFCAFISNFVIVNFKNFYQLL